MNDAEPRLNIRIKSINLLVTNRCNLWCKMCDYKVFRRTIQDIEAEHIFRLIDDALDLGLEYLNISGGEPMLRRDIYDIITHASSSNVTVALMSNGTLIGEKEASELARAGLKTAVISLEGEEEFNDMMRGCGNYRKAVDAIRFLKKHSDRIWCIKVGITLSKRNFMQVYDFSRFLIEDLGIDSISLSPFNKHLLHWKKTGYVDDFVFTEDSISDLKSELDHIISYYQTTKISIQDIGFLRKIPDYFSGKNMVPSTSCYQPLRGCAVEANGNVYPCWGDILIAGNIRKSSLKEIISTNEYRKICIKALTNTCKGCLLACYNDLHADR